MSSLSVDAVTAKTSNTDLTLSGNGTGDVVVNSNLGLGTSSPSAELHVSGVGDGTGSSDPTILLSSTGTGASDDTILSMQIGGTSANNYIFFGDSGDSDIGKITYNHTSDYMSFDTQASEAMRIDTNGNLLVGTTGSLVAGARLRASAAAATFEGEVTDGAGSGAVLWANRTASDGWIAAWYRGGSSVGSISVTASATAYNTSSDYRLKENIVSLSGAIDRVNLLKPSRFNFIVDPDTTVDGFVAHEVSDIVPEAVHGEKDAVDSEGNPVHQGIDQSKLVPLLTAALQESIAKIKALEARVAALEAA